MKHTLLSLCGALLLAATAAAQTTGITINTTTGLINIPGGSATPNFGALKVGGITLNPAGSSSIVTVGTLTSGSLGAGFTAVTNARLANSAITIGGTSTALGGTITTTTMLDSLGTTRGSVLYRGASGWSILAPGTSGYVLQANGSGADPTWHVGGAGDMLQATYDPQSAGYISGAPGVMVSGGTLNMDAGGGGGGGSINTAGGAGSVGGGITTTGGGGTSSDGGGISTIGGSATSTPGGGIFTYGGSSNSAAGGPVTTYGGALPGGLIETHDGGGLISTRGTGTIQLGVATTRTTLTGTATATRAIALPDASGTLLTIDPALLGGSTGGTTILGIGTNGFRVREKVGMVFPEAYFYRNQDGLFALTSSGLFLRSVGAVSWASDNAAEDDGDTTLVRADVGVVALRHGTADQRIIIGSASGTAGGGVLELNKIAIAPGTRTNGVVLYTKDVAGVAHLFVKKSDGTEVDLTP